MKHQAYPIAILLMLTSSAAIAQQGEDSASALAFDLHELIREVADDVGKEFLIDARMPPDIRAGYRSDDSADFESLRAILRMNGFAAIETSDHVLIVPVQNVRAEATRILNEDDARVSDHEIVTRVIALPDLPSPVASVQVASQDGQVPFQTSAPPLAAQLVPVLRPMMPNFAHLAAISGTNMLVMTDYYDNIRRVTAIIDEIVADLED